ncbi:hypothetical protein YC2023_035674 [Brassica napus]
MLDELRDLDIINMTPYPLRHVYQKDQTSDLSDPQTPTKLSLFNFLLLFDFTDLLCPGRQSRVKIKENNNEWPANMSSLLVPPSAKLMSRKFTISQDYVTDEA